MSLPAAFPSGLDALANPTATSECDDAGFELDLVISRIHDILEAIEAKVGIGASLPSATGVLKQTAPGTTGWGTISAAEIADGATMKRLGRVVLPGTTAVAQFTGIPSGYTALKLSAFVRATTPAAAVDTLILRVGAGTLDITANYDFGFVAGTGTTSAAGESYGLGYMSIGVIPAATATANRFGTAEATLANYAAASVNKDVVTQYHATWGTTAGFQQVGVYGGTWRSTAAIDTLAVYPLSGNNFAAGSVVTLYGLP